MDYLLDVLCVARVQPNIYILVRQYYWHPRMDFGKLGCGILCQNYYFIGISVKCGNKKVIRILWPETEGLLLLIPLVVSLHDHNTSVAYEIEEHSLLQHLLYTPVDD